MVVKKCFRELVARRLWSLSWWILAVRHWWRGKVPSRLWRAGRCTAALSIRILVGQMQVKRRMMHGWTMRSKRRGTNKKWPMRQTELSAKITMLQFNSKTQLQTSYCDIHTCCNVYPFHYWFSRSTYMPSNSRHHPILLSSHYCLPIIHPPPLSSPSPLHWHPLLHISTLRLRNPILLPIIPLIRTPIIRWWRTRWRIIGLLLLWCTTAVVVVVGWSSHGSLRGCEAALLATATLGEAAVYLVSI